MNQQQEQDVTLSSSPSIPTSFRAKNLDLLLAVLIALGLPIITDRSGSMWPTWIIHFFSDLQLVLLAHYSIFPHL